MLETAELKAMGRELGFHGIGVSEATDAGSIGFYRAWLGSEMHGEMAYLEKHEALKTGAKRLLPNAQSVIAVALNYNQTATTNADQPRIARYALGRDYHKVVRGKLRALQSRIREAHPSATFRICVDSAPLLEREYAHRAGLGWFGKNTCLIDSRFGSWFVLGFLLTSLEYAPDAPAIGGCGSCRKCVDACPTGAIIKLGDRWSVDSRRCISYLTIEKRGALTDAESKMLGAWTFGCDVCQDVCPFNEPRESQPMRASETAEPGFRARRKWPDLVDLAQIGEAEWDARSQGSPVRRAGIDGIRRNARANLSNSAHSDLNAG